MKFEQEVTHSTNRTQPAEADLTFNNTFKVEQIRDGRLIAEYEMNNAVSNEGINSILNTYFGSAAKKAAWYLGLIDHTGYSTSAVADTMSSHAGWTEFVTYAETARPTFVPTSSTAQSVTGTAVSEFTIGTVSSQSIEGIFVTDNGTKGGTSGMLWATALFSAAAVVLTGDVFRVTYTLRLGN